MKRGPKVEVVDVQRLAGAGRRGGDRWALRLGCGHEQYQPVRRRWAGIDRIEDPAPGWVHCAECLRPEVP